MKTRLPLISSRSSPAAGTSKKTHDCLLAFTMMFGDIDFLSTKDPFVFILDRVDSTTSIFEDQIDQTMFCSMELHVFSFDTTLLLQYYIHMRCMKFWHWVVVSNIFIFTPKIGEDEPILTSIAAYFSNGLVQPPTRKFLGFFGMNCSYQFTIHSGMKPLELTLVRRSAEQVQWLQALGNSRGKT